MSQQAALITGSDRGIGLATALALAHKGFNIALNAPYDNEQLEGALAKIAGLGVQVTSCVFDVADINTHAPALQKIETDIGTLTTLVNNAGVSVMERGDFLDVSPESYDHCMAVNVRGMFFLSQTFTKQILRQKREQNVFYSIINVTSSNAVAVSLPRSEYCVSKAAAAMISKVLAARLGNEQIFVYDVQPGLIATDMTAKVIDSYAQRAKEGLTLLPDVGKAEEVGSVIAILATGGLPYTTGQTISVDGGILVPRF